MAPVLNSCLSILNNLQGSCFFFFNRIISLVYFLLCCLHLFLPTFFFKSHLRCYLLHKVSSSSVFPKHHFIHVFESYCLIKLFSNTLFPQYICCAPSLLHWEEVGRKEVSDSSSAIWFDLANKILINLIQYKLQICFHNLVSLSGHSAVTMGNTQVCLLENKRAELLHPTLWCWSKSHNMMWAQKRSADLPSWISDIWRLNTAVWHWGLVLITVLHSCGKKLNEIQGNIPSKL